MSNFPTLDIEFNTCKFSKLNYSISYYAIFKPKNQKRSLPKTIYSTIDSHFYDRLQKSTPPSFIIKLEKGKLLKDDLIFTKDNVLLKDISSFKFKDSTKSGIISTIKSYISEKKPSYKYLRGKSLALTTSTGIGYYHWFVNSISRIALLEHIEESLESFDYVIVNQIPGKFHLETLSLLGIPRNKIIETYWNEFIEAEQLFVPSPTLLRHKKIGSPCGAPDWSFNYLRSALKNSKFTESLCGWEKIYINRRKTGHRKIHNEKEIEEYLLNQGFLSISMEEFSIKEKIKYLPKTQVVISPHGAGLTNLIFCSPKTKVIELLDYKATESIFYWDLSDSLGFDYYYLKSKSVNYNEFDISELDKILKLAEIN